MEIKLNLIPPYKKEEIKKAQYLKLIIKMEAILSVFVIVFFVFLLGLGHILDLNMEIVEQGAEASREKGQYEKIRHYDERFKEINSQIVDIAKIKGDQLYWSNMFFHFSQSILPGVSIQNLATKDYAVFLVGKADSRESLIAFKEKLERDECFSGVNLPLSNLVSKGSVDFQIDLEIREECVQIKNRK
ncbi:MAG TPA: hypothetical protein P5262_02115 [Candidatus Moranbacteria bacterium]|nr:hypothetical protein [Candidatus Moranbacteria bacterium]